MAQIIRIIRFNKFGRHEDVSTGLVFHQIEGVVSAYGIQASDGEVLPISEKLRIYCQKKGYPVAELDEWEEEEEELNDTILWDKLLKAREKHLKNFEDRCKHFLSIYGTSIRGNRFVVGNLLEFQLSDYIEKSGVKVEKLPNAKRVDLKLNNRFDLSIKYSKSGPIKLHNSNNCINKDMHMTNLILLTPKNLWLITNENLPSFGIDVKQYLKNNGDSLVLKRSLLTELGKINFKYKMDINLECTCKNISISETFYRQVMDDYEKEL